MLIFSLGLTFVACNKEKENNNDNNENETISDIIEYSGMPSFHYLNKLFGRTDLSEVKKQLSSDGWDYEWCVSDQIEEHTNNDSSYISIYVSNGQIIEVAYHKSYQPNSSILIDHIISIMQNEMFYAEKEKLSMTEYYGYYEDETESGGQFFTKESFIEAMNNISISDFRHGKSEAEYTTQETRIDFRSNENGCCLYYEIENG